MATQYLPARAHPTSAPPDGAASPVGTLPGNPRIALLHDYLVHVRGGERVLAALHRLYPAADVFTLVYDPSKLPSEYDVVPARTSFIQQLPLSRSHFRAYLPLYPVAAARLDVRDYDVVISSSSGWVHGARTNPLTRHVCYCHTPFRFAWSEYDLTVGHDSPLGPLQRRTLQPILAGIRARDMMAAREVDYFVANSRVVQERIARYYGRTSTVIYPPVDIDRYQPAERHDDYFLVVSALVSYKRVDIAVRAFTRLGLPLVVVGAGPELHALRRLAGPTIQFVGRVADEELSALYAHCRALVFTANEDFGITPLEAQAAGRPVLAFGAGGALETIVPGATGALFPAQTADALADAVRIFDASAYDPAVIRAHACRFREARFASQFHEYLTTLLQRPVAHTSPPHLIWLGSARGTPTRPPLSGAPALAAPPQRLGPVTTCVAALPQADTTLVRSAASYERLKRLLDIVGSGAALVLLAPVLLAIALLIRVKDGGPIIFRREIVGRGGRPVWALKFRTMITDADAYLARHPDLLRAYQANVKLRHDPRVTSTGAVLRRTSLDELPQLFNVLRGEMSLVGPRMIHPSEVPRYGAFASTRQLVRPGITGLWQISGRQDVSYAERVRLDLAYLRERSLWLDIRILLRTFVVLIRRTGAY